VFEHPTPAAVRLEQELGDGGAEAHPSGRRQRHRSAAVQQQRTTLPLDRLPCPGCLGLDRNEPGCGGADQAWIGWGGGEEPLQFLDVLEGIGQVGPCSGAG
jgi:hypothetical protein